MLITHSINSSHHITILDRHAPLKKANQKYLKLSQKPWITKGILCSIKKRDSIFRELKNAETWRGK